jgi:hypothetical protein
MTTVSHWPNVIESKPVSAPPIAVAIDDRKARTALKIAEAHALCADILTPAVLVGPRCMRSWWAGRADVPGLRTLRQYALLPS